MAGYSANVEIDPQFHSEALIFINFLKSVGKKYPVIIRYKTSGKGKFYFTIDGSPGRKIDALFQELILNKGLYYYACSVSGAKRNLIISKVIAPIYGDVVYNFFENPYGKFLIRHIKGIIPQNKYIPGDFNNDFSNEYEILFRRWDINQIDDWDFVVSLDAFLTRFLLRAIGHEPGQKSENFNTLLERALSKSEILITPEISLKFLDIHNTRTSGLHRLQENLTKEVLGRLAMEFYSYFDYLNDFIYSQKEKTEKLGGKRYRKIKYGDEVYLDEDGNPWTINDENGNPIDYRRRCMNQPCGDCNVKYGQIHVFGCDWEQCPKCKGQALGCGCRLDSDFD